jgi:hypothetical protein
MLDKRSGGEGEYGEVVGESSKRKATDVGWGSGECEGGAAGSSSVGEGEVRGEEVRDSTRDGESEPVPGRAGSKKIND